MCEDSIIAYIAAKSEAKVLNSRCSSASTAVTSLSNPKPQPGHFVMHRALFTDDGGKLAVVWLPKTGQNCDPPPGTFRHSPPCLLRQMYALKLKGNQKHFFLTTTSYGR